MPVSDRVAILLDGEFVKKALGVFYYTAEPLCRTAVHPLDATVIDFARTPVFRLNTRLIDAMENEPDVAVRRGTLAHQGWEIGGAAIVVISGDADLVPAMKLARREGLRVFLDTLGRTSVRSELKVHADRVV